VYEFNVPTFGKGVVFDVDQKVRTEQFRWFAEGLKKDALKSYVPHFVYEAEVCHFAVVSLTASTAFKQTAHLHRSTSSVGVTRVRLILRRSLRPL
jgi:hypothetical protein